LNNLRILTYHRVANLNKNSNLNPNLISATPAVFKLQMEYLAKRYNVVSIKDVFDAIDGKVKIPRKAVMITFDDAYHDFGEIAWPILKKLGLTATLFVPTAYPGNSQLSFWWDRLYSSVIQTSKTNIQSTGYGRLCLETRKDRLNSLGTFQKYLKTLTHDDAMLAVDEICSKLNYNSDGIKSTMSWDELRKLAKEGVALGAHTRNHIILTQVSQKKVRDEIRGSLEDLKRETGEVLPIFSYPNGNYNRSIVQIAKEEGVVVSFGTRDGHNNLNRSDLMRLRRTNITRKTSPIIFSLRLLKIFSYFDIWRHRNRNYF